MVGIDIGSKTIKIVELVKSGNKIRLKASGIVVHKGKTPDIAKEEKDMVEVSEAIKKLYKEAKISSRDVAIALPEAKVYTRVIKFPPLTDSEIASAVKWEAEQYIPIPMNEAIIQYQVIERREDLSPAQVSVLLVAAQKAMVDKYARCIEMASVNLVAVETELMSLVRSLAPNEGTVLLVDFGARSTDIAIAKNSQLMFSRSIPTAGDALTRALAQSLSITPLQAEEYKKTYGLSSQLEGRVKKALDPVFKIVADEMKKAIYYYMSEEKGDSPASAVLAGGSAGLPEVAGALTKMLGLEVVVGNPFAKIEVDPEALRSLSGYSPLYSIAVGLAMRES